MEKLKRIKLNPSISTVGGTMIWEYAEIFAGSIITDISELDEEDINHWFDISWLEGSNLTISDFVRADCNDGYIQYILRDDIETIYILTEEELCKMSGLNPDEL